MWYRTDEFEKKATNYYVRFGRSLRSAITTCPSASGEFVQLEMKFSSIVVLIAIELFSRCSWFRWTGCTAACRRGRRRRWRRPRSGVSSRLSWSWPASQRRTVARQVSCHRWWSRRNRRRHRRKTRRRITSLPPPSPPPWQPTPSLWTVSRRHSRNSSSSSSSSQPDATWVAEGPPGRSGWLRRRRNEDRYAERGTRWQQLDAASEEWITPMPC